MFIKELIIEGFKSYAQRTVFKNFDRFFSSITGLNGSGKSNSLDAICFCLGITNLSQVRAQNLQELVYKKGQAGVTKASVSIVFNNEDRENSPVGYESFKEITVTRQIVIGGRSKYLINGKNAQLNKVKNLFHSVQLNVNNPHFLIMQGRITKVLNMKPLETLGMIEEASGTRMFEDKKRSAFRIMKKKDTKVDEISKVLDTEITPTIERLREEKQQYLKWSQNKNEYERLKKFVIAYEYTRSLNLVENSKQQEIELKNEVSETENQIEILTNDLTTINKESKVLLRQKDERISGKYKKLEKQVTAFSKEFIKQTTNMDHFKETKQNEEKNQKQLNANKKSIEKSIKKKQKLLETKEKELFEIEKEHKEMNLQLEELQLSISAISVTVSNNNKEKNETSGKTLAGQLNHYKQQITQNETIIKEKNMKIKFQEEELSKMKPRLKEAKREFAKLQKKSQALELEITKIENEIQGMGYDSDKHKSLIKQIDQEELVRERIQNKLDQLSIFLEGLEFIYQSPTQDFNPDSVKGIVARLFEVKNPEMYHTALEIVAGGRLFNVVVDTVENSKLLIKFGKLRKRVTMIPLDKIVNYSIDKRIISKAQRKVGKENVQTSKSLLDYDRSLEPAMNYVFGGTFVCKNLELAEKVTFDREIRKRTVTVDGSDLNPVGTMTGGSIDKKRNVLDLIKQFNDLRSEYHNQNDKIEGIKNLLLEQEKLKRQSSILTNELELKIHELKLIKETIVNSPQCQIITQFEESGELIEKLKMDKIELKKEQEKNEKKVIEIEKDLEEFENGRENKVKETEIQIKKIKKKVDKHAQVVQKQLELVEQIKFEKNELIEELEKNEAKITKIEQKIEKMEKELEIKRDQIKEKENELKEFKGKLEDEREKLIVTDKKIGKLNQQKTETEKNIEERNLQLKRLNLKLTRFIKEQESSANRITDMEKQHKWIKSEKKLFGKKHSDYDFTQTDPTKASQNLESILKEQQTLEKSLNRKVMGMLEEAGTKYQDLCGKRETILKDRKKIEQVIQELDIKKRKALRATWKKVNKDFGSIFGTLLPGTSAKLVPIDIEEIQKGLEIKVAFSGQWKESLTELSGGQRSLLALSLILSLLLFKPAPIYILDEVDSALDLSHTANIGKMLKNKFGKSQFIIVSLKEGMFENANVIFRTEFVDGRSTVTRLDNRSRNQISNVDLIAGKYDKIDEKSDKNEKRKKEKREKKKRRKNKRKK
ncbi:structural maintenance of chromosomes protein [Anaeramoeba flamelloides]|uniref:Structural maintenance of chromosomes protein n=1 Tax=Anaeramoeba flamelloides TaxID=1746091 RepID=A0ABQ8YSI9_9EUKA|nr:structural maintenance of chromosomes protein [Anaeramoeba flamelloides]